MSGIVEWLEEVEHRAADLYAAAAVSFAADPAFSAFLRQLASEEEWHRQLLRSLLANGTHAATDEALITIDKETRANISGLLSKGHTRLAAGEMSRSEMLETIAAVEFSEWNDIFPYVLHTLQAGGREYQAAVAEIERHKEHILRFLAAEPGGGRLLETLMRLPAVADKGILIVEKHPALARLLRNIVATVGEGELVESGPEGLVRLENEHFDVIISDINMLAMSSLEFYARVTGRNPEMKDRFVFFAGAASDESLETLDDGEITVLVKPALISQIRRAVAGIAHKSRVFH